MKKMLLYLCIAAMFLFILAACGGTDNNDAANGNGNANVSDQNNEEPDNSENNNADESNDSASKETSYPLTVTDSTGETLTFEAAPERIISTSPAETEVLFALGLGEQIIGVSDFDNYPEETAAKQKVGSIVDPNVETILDLEPDLVVTGISISEEAVEYFRQFDVKLYRTNPASVQDVMDNILVMGEITNRQIEAEQLVAQMQADIDYVAEAVSGLADDEKKKVLIEFSPGWTVGEGEFMHELLEMAGGVNVAGDTSGWLAINEEKIIQDDPDVILYGAAMVVDEQPLNEVIAARSGWDQITAVKNGAIHPIDDDILSRPGPRLSECIKLMAEAIYPELFGA